RWGPRCTGWTAAWPRSAARNRTDARPRDRAPASTAAETQARTDPADQRAPRPGRREDAAVPARVLRRAAMRVDAGGDAGTVGVERRRARAVRRVHLTPQQVRLLNGVPRRGRVAGFQRRYSRKGGAR